jgi:hypothetical protein
MASMVVGGDSTLESLTPSVNAPLETYKGKYITECVKSSRDRQV